MKGRALAVVGLTSLIGAMAFLWPLLVEPDSTLAHNDDAPLLFAEMLPLLLGDVLAALSDGRTVEVNRALLRSNAALAGRVAVAWSELDAGREAARALRGERETTTS